MLRLLPATAILASLVGCSATPRRDATWGTLTRPGDAERATVLPPRRGEAWPTPTHDPLPALEPGEWRTEAPLLFHGWPAGGRAGPTQPLGGTTRAPQGSAPLGRWSVVNGDLAIPLDPSSRVRVGISAGGRSLEDDGYGGGRRAFPLAPGVCFERDL